MQRFDRTINSWQGFQYVVRTLSDEEFEKVEVDMLRELLNDNNVPIDATSVQTPATRSQQPSAEDPG